MISTRPFVSVVMPVYNGDDYFHSALESVLNQSYDHFEVVVIDDGSRDPTFVAQTCRDAGSQVRYIYQKNTGVAGALNHGIREMRGDVFCWLSHDDLFLPHKLERQVAYHASLGLPDAILFSDYEVMDSAGRPTMTIRAPRDRLLRAPKLALLNGCINGCTIYIPAPVIKASGGFDTAHRYTQDYHLWNLLLREHDFFHQPEVLVRYRVHEAQGSNLPAAVEEADRLWTRMVEDRSEFERVAMYGSSYQFYVGIAGHLAQTPYQATRDRLQQLAAGAVSASTLTTILCAPATEATARAAWNDVVRRTVPRLEVIWHDHGTRRMGRIDVNGVARPIDVGPVAEQAGFLNAAAAAARGDYIAFVTAPFGETVARLSGAVTVAHQIGATIGLANVATGRCVAAKDLIVGADGTPGTNLDGWIFHASELIASQSFRDDLVSMHSGAAMAAVLGERQAVGLLDAASAAA